MSILLKPDISWVGCVDWSVRDFHGYDAARGTTYNAYLVRDTQTALIDTVRQEFAPALLQNLAAALGDCPDFRGHDPSGDARHAAARENGTVPLSGQGPATLDYLVVNHAEPDHSGAMVDVLAAHPETVVVCNAKCRAALAKHFATDAWKFQVVAEGQSLELGRRRLVFHDTPMVHWPESMWTWLPEERLLFSMDVFGQHLASSPRFDDEMPADVLDDEAKTYYANILAPYPAAVAAALRKFDALGVETIAPSHGIVWRRRPAEIVAAYRGWASGRTAPVVVVLYDTMWGSTRAMAEAIAEGASQPGIQARLLSMHTTSLTRIAAEVLDAAAVAVGCPTLNRGPMPSAAAAMSYLRGLYLPAKAALAFGSYGWGPGGPETLQEELAALGWQTSGPPLKCQYRPTPDVLAACRAAGERLAELARQPSDAANA